MLRIRARSFTEGRPVHSSGRRRRGQAVPFALKLPADRIFGKSLAPVSRRFRMFFPHPAALFLLGRGLKGGVVVMTVMPENSDELAEGPCRSDFSLESVGMDVVGRSWVHWRGVHSH